MTLKWYPAQDVDRNGRIGNSIYSYESSTKLIISGCEIRNNHLPYEHSLKPDYEECYIAKNHTMQFTNISYSVSAKLYCFTSSFFTRPNLAISVVLELSNRDSEHRWWTLLSTSDPCASFNEFAIAIVDDTVAGGVAEPPVVQNNETVRDETHWLNSHLEEYGHTIRHWWDTSQSDWCVMDVAREYLPAMVEHSIIFKYVQYTSIVI